MSGLGWRHAVVFGVLLASFLLLITRNVSPEPYFYDEADYMYAASLGWVANWTDTPSIATTDFVRAGLNRTARSALSAQIRDGSDVLFYRHFHGPLFHYLLIPISRLHLTERSTRSAVLAIPCIGIAVMYFGCLWLTGSFAVAVFASVLYLTGYSVIGSIELAPHQLFAVCVLASLILLMRPSGWYGSVVFAALACCTLEIGIVLPVTLAIVGWVQHRSNIAWKSLALFFGTILIIWPAAIFRLSVLKAYAVMGYLALSRDSPWGKVTLIDTWRARFVHSPVEWAFIVIGICCIWKWRLHSPITLFAGLMIATTFRVFSVTPRYALAFTSALDLLAGLAFEPVLSSLRRPASLAGLALAVAGLYGNAWYQVSHHPNNPNPRSAAVLTFIQQNGLENKFVLAAQSDVPTLHYYFPRMKLRSYYGCEPTSADIAAFAPDAIIPASTP